MASSGMGVWISIQSLSVIRLYHATSCEHLADVDTKDAVHKMLAGQYNTEIIFILLKPCHVTRCKFSRNLQRNSTVERGKLGKYASSLHFANVFFTYQTVFTNYHLLSVEFRCTV